MAHSKLMLLAAASVFALASTANAQDSAATTADAVETTTDANAELEFLKAQIEALQTQVTQLSANSAKSEPSWKGAPQWQDKDAGLSFKIKGFAQFDAGYVSTPGPNLAGTVGGLAYNNLGFNTRSRRLVLGAEGSLPGNFSYKAEFNFAQSSVDYEDIILSWKGKGPLQVTVGNFYPISSLETVTSSRLGSFMERAGITEAFNYNRRLGVAVAYVDPADILSLTAGVWSQEINDSTNFSRTAWQASVRGVYSPTLGSTRLHLGANFQHRVAARDAQSVRYRVRPFSQTTDQRFVDTNLIAADGDDILGVELAAIRGPLHFAGEAQKLWVRGYAPGKTFGANNGAAGASFYADDPSFWGGYAEIGFYLTGETRAYKGGKWDRVKVLKPVGSGGMGAVQINARLDYTNLNDATGTGAVLGAPNYVNGGRQLGYQASVIWNPVDYVRILAQYSRAHVNGGPRATTVVPGTVFTLDRSYNVDQIGLRAQFEF